jgi:hypothetical protein
MVISTQNKSLHSCNFGAFFTKILIVVALDFFLSQSSENVPKEQTLQVGS